MNKPHIHAEAIKAWADGAVIQFQNSPDGNWFDVEGEPTWHKSLGYRIKPEPKYPETRMTGEELRELYMRDQGIPQQSHIVVANAAIRRAIQDGDVVLLVGNA